jgi:hypothetical protein
MCGTKIFLSLFILKKHVMKKYLGFFALISICFVTWRCSDKVYGEPTLNGVDALFIYPGMSYSVPLSGGSGNYTVDVRDGGEPAAFADVFIERSADSISLVVKTHEGEGGSAIINVTDTESGYTAQCYLNVSAGSLASGWDIDEQQHAIDALSGSGIEADLQSKLFPVGSILTFDPHIEHVGRYGAGIWVVQKIENGVADTLACGTFTSMPLKPGEASKAYDTLPIEQDIQDARRYLFQQEDGEHVYDLFYVYTRESRGSIDRMMYENRTEYYRAQSNGLVNSVVNRYVQRY